jgi:hypothetical protein
MKLRDSQDLTSCGDVTWLVICMHQIFEGFQGDGNNI